MKLLLVTQIVDADDAVLGFFHRWIEEFAKHAEQVTVICLKEGIHSLPENVRVFSLGKEHGPASRLTYMRRYFQLLWRERHTYDTVMTHMNPEYLILGAPLWRLMGKRVSMWYAHGTVSFRLRLATLLTQYIYTSTPKGYRLKSKKAHVVGQGIDCEHFTFAPVGDVTKLVSVGRISRLKNLDLLIDAVAAVRSKGIEATLDLYGEPLTDDDTVYERELLAHITKTRLESVVRLCGPVTQAQLPLTLHKYGTFVNAGQTGSLDKATLEPAATGRIVLSSNPGVQGVLREVCTVCCVEHDPDAFARALEKLAAMDTSQREVLSHELRTLVLKHHTTGALIRNILTSLSVA
jgi:glycosyltransferase involved in cell wall biosynthesis